MNEFSECKKNFCCSNHWFKSHMLKTIHSISPARLQISLNLVTIDELSRISTANNNHSSIQILVFFSSFEQYSERIINIIILISWILISTYSFINFFLFFNVFISYSQESDVSSKNVGTLFLCRHLKSHKYKDC